MSSALYVEHLGPDDLAELSAELCELYRRCFTEAPWHEPVEQVAAYTTLLAEHLAKPGMSAVVARDDERLGGVVYGWPAPAQLPQDPFHDALVAQMPPSVCRELVAPSVVVVELMVHPDYRRRGIGRALLNRYVEGHPAAWLCTHPDAQAATLYESTGWQRRGTFINPYGGLRVLYTRRTG